MPRHCLLICVCPSILYMRASPDEGRLGTCLTSHSGKVMDCSPVCHSALPLRLSMRSPSVYYVTCIPQSTHCHTYSIMCHRWTPVRQHEPTHMHDTQSLSVRYLHATTRCLSGLQSRCQAGVASQPRRGSSPKDTGSRKNVRTATPRGAHVTSGAVVETWSFASIEIADTWPTDFPLPTLSQPMCSGQSPSLQNHQQMGGFPDMTTGHRHVLAGGLRLRSGHSIWFRGPSSE